ncbi:MAG: branched-chain amino acid ABC transporter permease [Chloroflexi bacterium AL-W]|nr:branched-chain amino acid ABC transporter permease [Chloroflexi bacterium AL-N1]NOK66881.1 branched-chain amino acid ABC transporter permease [Chloroflexi bacterium AL-N10]NOK74827.1 branched-chain amino acid ABC transporter permease [Chloroflexi bacterium AL-N5]NOK81483.1 branched-chain amino acid ABC transporter permease [Chloroflexi bacterium AL-W]NOK88953.1 branched-chain amino acid ABC transporter permease [Chloroflexi bacterium AL-N15]
MSVEANTGSSMAIQRSFRTILAEVFGPLLQILLFVVGSAVVLSTLVIVLAILLNGLNPDVDLLQSTLVILLQVIIDGLGRGFLFATIALGYTMVYGVLGFINFAHGEIFMVGAFVGAGFGATLAGSGALEGMNPFLFVVIAVLLGMAVSGLLAMATERIAYRPLRNAPRLVPLISAIGMSLFLQDAVRLISTSTGLGFNVRFQTPDLGRPITLAEIPIGDRVAFASISSGALIFIVSSVLMLIGLNYLVNVTKLGKAIRAVAQDRATASLMGINVNQIIALTFLIGGALGGAAGVLFGISVGTINPYVGFLPGLKAFTAAVLGGIGNITGAMVGGIVLGFLEAFVSSYLSLFTGGTLSGAAYADMAAFSILVFILIFRPSGLLGEATTQKV